MFTFAQGIGPLAIAPIFPELAKDFHSDIAGVVHFTGVTILVLGFSSFLWYTAIHMRFSTGKLTRSKDPFE